MKIAWASPFHEQSAIGRDFSLPVARELTLRGHHVEIIRTELQKAGDLPAIDFEGRIHDSREFASKNWFGGFDVVAVNWGNSFPDHGGALALTEAIPAVAILHDADMRGFAAAASKFYKVPVEQFATVLPPTYRGGDLEPGLEPDSARVLAWFAALAASAVVHERRGLSLVQAACPGRVCCMPEVRGDQAAYSPGFAKAYVNAVLPLIDGAIATRPMLDAGLQIGAILQACGARLDEPAIGRIGDVINELFDPAPANAGLAGKAPGERR